MRRKPIARAMNMGALLAICVSAEDARAQGAPPPPDQAMSEGATLDDIVVTAQRRSERLQDVPISVLAVGGSQLANAAITSTADITYLAPGFTSQAANGFFKPYVRGVGSASNGAGLDNAVAVYVDGVYYASATASIITFPDVERVEILKGPQGTLFGRNATGGVVQVVTKDPGDDTELAADISYGSYQTFNARGYLGGALTSGIRASVSAQYTRQGEGYGTNFFDGKDAFFTDHDLSVRGKLVFEPGPDTVIKLSGDYTDRDAPLFGYRLSLDFQPAFAASPRVPSASPWDTNTNGPNINRLKGGGGSARIEQALGSVDLISITAYRRTTATYANDPDATPLPVLYLIGDIVDRQFSQELQLQSDDGGAFQWTAGGFYLNASGRQAPTDLIFGGPLTPAATSVRIRRTFSDIGTDALAAFGQATVKLGDRTSVTGGLRYSSEKRSISGSQSVILVNGAVTTTPVIPRSRRFNKLTWRLALDHKFSTEVMGYASYNRGFKSGGYAPSFPNNDAFLPEQIDAYEVGIKSELADRRVRLNLAAFYYDYKNLQVSFVFNNANGIGNGAKVEVYGLDGELEAVLGDHLTLSGGVGLLHSRFTSYPSGVRTVPRAGGGFTQVLGADLTGNDTPNAPSFTGNLGADIHFPGPSGEFGLTFNYLYNSGYFMESDNLVRQPAYHMMNITGRWISPSKHWSARLWVKNLFNEAIYQQAAGSNLNIPVNYGAPRTLGATIGVNF